MNKLIFSCRTKYLSYPYAIHVLGKTKKNGFGEEGELGNVRKIKKNVSVKYIKNFFRKIQKICALKCAAKVRNENIS